MVFKTFLNIIKNIYKNDIYSYLYQDLTLYG